MIRVARMVPFLMVLMMVAGCAGRGGGSGAQTTSASVSGPAVAVQKKIAYANQSGVRLAVKKECDLQTKVPHFVEYYAPDYGVNVQLVEDLDASDAPRSLKLEIVDLEAPEDWTDEDAWMLVVGELYENGRRIATVKSLRATEGGAFAEFKSSCAIIGRCSKAIGDDLAGWLSDPEDGAHIGDWRSGYLPHGHPHSLPSPGPTPGPSPPTPGVPGPW